LALAAILAARNANPFSARIVMDNGTLAFGSLGRVHELGRRQA
jgi:hypothetical protein